MTTIIEQLKARRVKLRKKFGITGEVLAWERELDEAVKEIERGYSEGERRLDALELAWGVIANAYGGDWSRATPDWVEAATRWRDLHWHPMLHDATQGQSDEAEPVSEELKQCPKCDDTYSGAYCPCSYEVQDNDPA